MFYFKHHIYVCTFKTQTELNTIPHLIAEMSRGPQKRVLRQIMGKLK